MLLFILGTTVGFFVGIVVISLIQANKYPCSELQDSKK